MADDVKVAVLSNPAAVVGAGFVGILSVVAILKYLSTPSGKRKPESTLPKLPKLGPPPKFSSSDPDVLVIGGGVLGASIAARFGMDGKNVVMVEQNMGIDDTFRGEVMLPGGIECLDKMGMKDVMDEIDGNPVVGAKVFDTRVGGEPGVVYYPKSGGLAMHHGYFVDALRKKAMAQETVTVIEAIGKELIWEKGRVVGAKYKKKGKDEPLKEIRAPLTVLGDGYFSKLSNEFRTTHQTVSDASCVAFIMKDYEFHNNNDKRYLEFSVGHPNGQIAVYRLNEHETRAMAFVHGPSPTKLNDFFKEKIIPYAPEHMKKYLIEGLKNGPQARVLRTKQMAANFDVTPGVLILGDALNTRHPVTASGMTVALNDVVFWWNAINNKTNGFTDDEGILKQKLIFRKERQKWAFTINVFAHIAVTLFSDHDPSTIAFQQHFVKALQDFEEPNYTNPKIRDYVYNIFGLVETDPEVLRYVLDDTLQGTIQDCYNAKPFFLAFWEARKIRQKWEEITGEIMRLEGMT